MSEREIRRGLYLFFRVYEKPERLAEVEWRINLELRRSPGDCERTAQRGLDDEERLIATNGDPKIFEEWGPISEKWAANWKAWRAQS